MRKISSRSSTPPSRQVMLLRPKYAREDSDVCHSCRETGHFFADCLKKRHCPWCKVGFVKCFEIEKNTKNKGKKFDCCSANCKYREWFDNGESSGGSNCVTVNVNNNVEEDQQLSRLFQTRCRVNEAEKIEIQLTVTICKANESSEVDRKGKGPA